MANVELLTQYYIEQAGTGNSAFYSGPIYQRGSGSCQRGAGIGSFLGGLFRRILPILKKGTTALGREVIKGGSDFLSDISNNVDPKKALKTRSREVVTNALRNVMRGDGYKRRNTASKRQLSSAPQQSNIKRRKITKKKVTPRKPTNKKKQIKKRTKDIFSN